MRASSYCWGSVEEPEAEVAVEPTGPRQETESLGQLVLVHRPLDHLAVALALRGRDVAVIDADVSNVAGLLYKITHTLAEMDLDIHMAIVNTVADRARDAFYVVDRQGEKILWAPDRHLGNHVRERTGADVLCWEGECIVHDEFKAKGIVDLKALHPEAAVLVHPESPASVVEIADVVG